MDTDLERLTKRVNDLELELRSWFWLNHGHVRLYGDDGEMQCSECQLWDYKRGDLDRLREQVTTTKLKQAFGGEK